MNTFIVHRRWRSCVRAAVFLHEHCVSRSRVVSFGGSMKDSYLVDPASSHMLVSKIKPCMSKYEHLYCETANGSLNQL